MVREIVTYPDPVLSKRAEEISEIDEEIKSLVQDMVETMYEKQGIGLAAPQIGVSKRLAVVDVSGPEKREDLKVLINPVLVSKQGSLSNEEGCLSCPGFQGKATRAEEVVVEALDLKGQKQKIEAQGLLAVCLQHELEHLDGKLLVDHAGRLKRSMYDKKIKKHKKG